MFREAGHRAVTGAVAALVQVHDDDIEAAGIEVLDIVVCRQHREVGCGRKHGAKSPQDYGLVVNDADPDHDGPPCVTVRARRLSQRL